MNAFPAGSPHVRLKGRTMLGALKAAFTCSVMGAPAQGRGWGASSRAGIRTPAQGQALDASRGY